MRKPKYVHADGPYSAGISDFTGDEYCQYTVSIMDNNDDEIKSYTCGSYAKAMSLAEAIARDRKIPFHSDMTR